MSATAVSRRPPSGSPGGGIRTRRWTREEYHRAAQLGLFRPEERLELLDGEIIEQVSPQNPPNAAAVTRGGQILDSAFGPGSHVRTQLPFVLNGRSEPEPDLLVVAGTPFDYASDHPRAADTHLLVEVCDTTLRLDRGRKKAAYARARVQEYWILNLPDRQLEVFRDPSGARYRSSSVHGEQESVTPLAAPDSLIRVADLLPPRLPDGE